MIQLTLSTLLVLIVAVMHYDLRVGELLVVHDLEFPQPKTTLLGLDVTSSCQQHLHWSEVWFTQAWALIIDRLSLVPTGCKPKFPKA